MFPLAFPYAILSRNAEAGELVLDPFCGRGTTNFAARMHSLPSVGIDISPVAVAATRARLANATPDQIVDEAARILRTGRTPNDVPASRFWITAFETGTLNQICALREALLLGSVDQKIAPALTGILLGALHGPLGKATYSYFSNQCPRTYAPKPDYAVRYWNRKGLRPPQVDVLSVIKARAERYFGTPLPRSRGTSYVGDSRTLKLLKSALRERKADWIITSPPYYGLRTYVEDQWLRAWLLGGPATVDYNSGVQLNHGSPSTFANELRGVWRNVWDVASPRARLVIRFGAINDRPIDPSKLIKSSLEETGWRITTIRPAGTALDGKRQAQTFVRAQRPHRQEIDVYCRRV